MSIWVFQALIVQGTGGNQGARVRPEATGNLLEPVAAGTVLESRRFRGLRTPYVRRESEFLRACALAGPPSTFGLVAAGKNPPRIFRGARFASGAHFP